MRKTLTVINTSLLALFSLISLIPFYIMVVMGTHTDADLFTKLSLWPGKYALTNIKTVFANHFLQFYSNSLVISIASTVLSVIVSALAGFALAKYRFRSQKVILTAILATMMLPQTLGTIGYVMEVRLFGIAGTLMPLILPFIANAFGVFWFYQNIKDGVPTEMLESARIDGCPEPGIFARIVLPQIRPAIVTMSLLVFLSSWNSFFLPLVLIVNPEQYTVPLGITMLGNQYTADYGAQIMALSLGTLPIAILLMFGARYFVQGLAAGAIKG